MAGVRRPRRREFGINTMTLVPLTAGKNRFGAFGFSSVAPYEPSPAEFAFLERVASEFAVAVESSSPDRKQCGSATGYARYSTSPMLLYPSCRQTSYFPRLPIRYRESSGTITRCSRFATMPGSSMYTRYIAWMRDCREAVKGPFNPDGMPAAEVLATGKPVVALATDVDRYPNPSYSQLWHLE